MITEAQILSLTQEVQAEPRPEASAASAEHRERPDAAASRDA